MTLDESIPNLRRPDFDARSEPRWRRTIPQHLAAVLHAAHDDEREALGPHRRAAYLLTRQLISSLLEAGYPARLLAAELGVRTESVRTRAQAGWTHLADIAALSTVGQEELLGRCAASGTVVDDDGRVFSDHLVRILSAPHADRDDL